MADRFQSRRRKVVGMTCLLFLVACFLPCVDTGTRGPTGDPSFPDPSEGRPFGLVILLFGWGGGNHGVPWSANVFLALGLACLARDRARTAAALGAVASILGLTTWLLNSFSRPHNIDPLGGYYFWQASQFVLAGGALWASRAPATPSGATRVATEPFAAPDPAT
jgi:hypothetical protein